MTRLSVSQTIPCMASLKSSCTAPLLRGSALRFLLCTEANQLQKTIHDDLHTSYHEFNLRLHIAKRGQAVKQGLHGAVSLNGACMGSTFCDMHYTLPIDAGAPAGSLLWPVFGSSSAPRHASTSSNSSHCPARAPRKTQCLQQAYTTAPQHLTCLRLASTLSLTQVEQLTTCYELKQHKCLHLLGI